MNSAMQVDREAPLGVNDALSHWKEVTKQTNVLLSPKLTLESYWTRKTRPDGRLLSQCRPLAITKGVLRKTTHGSSLLTLDTTRVVVAAVNVQVGRIVVPGGGGSVNVTVSAVSSQTDTGNLQSWLERTLQETLDLQQLIISPSHAFSLQIGLQILSESAGNLRDACLLAALAACQDTILPETITADAKNPTSSVGSSKPQSGILYFKPDSEAKRTIQLPVIAIPLTLGLWETAGAGKSSSANTTRLEWIVDPKQLELQHGCCGQLTIVVDAMTNRILQCDWASLTAVDPSMLALAVRMAQGRAQELKSEFAAA